MSIMIYRTNKENPIPKYMSKGASGIDLYASLGQPVTLVPGEYSCVPSGIIISLPEGLEAQIRPRSGLALKHGITLLNTPGTIDSDYRGLVSLIMTNLGSSPFKIKRGDRVAKLVIKEVVRATLVETGELDETVRSSGGFGHTGK